MLPFFLSVLLGCLWHIHFFFYFVISQPVFSVHDQLPTELFKFLVLLDMLMILEVTGFPKKEVSIFSFSDSLFMLDKVA